MEEFTQNYGVPEDGRYIITRDLGTYAILKEVEAAAARHTVACILASSIARNPLCAGRSGR